MPVRKERAALLRALGEAALKSHIDGLKGKRLELHVEQPTLGRTPCFTEVVLTAPQKVGTVVQATLTGREQHRATAEV
jgi:threonylcarbamoyladenosine tRNA methylthiotransferase MtaB